MSTAAFRSGQKTRIEGLKKAPQGANLKSRRVGAPKPLMSAKRVADRQRWKAEYEKKRPTAKQRGYGKEWRVLREKILQRSPECAMCGTGATVVDHIIPHRGDQDLFWDRANLQSLCASCHSRKTFEGR